MTAPATAPYISPPSAVLAEGAHIATTPGDCPLCPRPIRAGQRIAYTEGTGWAHVPCIAATAKAT
jgi:hypothetical protein